MFSFLSSPLGQIVATAVCHTDLHHLLESMHKEGFPTVLGHEAAGIVESVGPGVTEYQPGQFQIVQHFCVFALFRKEDCMFCAAMLAWIFLVELGLTLGMDPASFSQFI